MNRLLMAAVLAATIARPAAAGYIATTNDAAVNGGVYPPGLVGFNVTDGTFASYTADGPTDPQITAGDLANFRWNFAGGAVLPTGTITTGAVTNFAGSYTITYVLGNVLVSGGTFVMTADDTNRSLNGVLTQTAGPADPAFADLSEGGRNVLFVGRYNPPSSSRGIRPFAYPADPAPGTVNGAFILPAPPATATPVPATLPAAVLGVTALAGLVRRRRLAA